MTTDSTTLSYWLNWRVFLCAIWVLATNILAAFLIWKYEGFNRRRKSQQATVGFVCKDEVWQTCLKGFRPAWLLAYRITVFVVLLALLIANIVLDGVRVFFFYTQWTFALVTIYFAIGSFLSIQGYFQPSNSSGINKKEHVNIEQGNLLDPQLSGNEENFEESQSRSINDEGKAYPAAGVWGYIFQIIFQMSAGAVMLTDIVFWLVLYPFFTSKDFNLNFIDVSMHSINAVFLLGDIFFNCLRFPVFRFAYFISWTSVYVIYQWIFHAFVAIGWPYEIIDLASPYAPLWYLAISLLHIPCYGVFYLIVRLKHLWLSRSFPQSYQSFN